MQRADVLYNFLRMPTNADKSGSTLSGEFWEGRLNGVSGTLGFPLERSVSLMLVTMLISARGVKRTLVLRFSGGWAFASAVRREVLASLDVSNTAATSFPPSRRCRLKTALCLMSFSLSQGLRLYWRQTCGRNPAKHSALQTHLRRLLRVHNTGGLARLVRLGREERRACSP